MGMLPLVFFIYLYLTTYICSSYNLYLLVVINGRIKYLFDICFSLLLIVFTGITFLLNELHLGNLYFIFVFFIITFYIHKYYLMLFK